MIYKWNKLLFISVILLILNSCGGGGSSNVPANNDVNNDSTQPIVIKGKVVDDPIIGATVKLLSLDNDELQTATTDSNGSYSLNISKDKISNGFMLEATGGTMNGIDFNYTLRAIYSADQDLEKANITLITTFVAKMAMEDSINRSGTLIDNRDKALQKLDDMGMLKKSDWFSEEPSLVNMEELRATVQGDGLNVWLDRTIVDLNDSELGQDKMRIFEFAHGGLLSVSTSPSNFISIFSGQEKELNIFAEVIDTNNTNISIRKVNGVDWITIKDNKLLIAPPSDLDTYGDFTFNIEILANNIVIGRTKTIIVSLVKKVVLVSGELGSEGGKIENEWKDISISVDANKLSQTYQIEYNAGVTTDGRLTLWAKSIPKMTIDEELSLKLIQPNYEIIKKNYLEINISPSLNTKKLNRSVYDTNYASDSVPSECRPIKRNVSNKDQSEMVWTDENGDKLMFEYVWQGKVALFDTNNKGTFADILNPTGGLPRLIHENIFSVNGHQPEILCASALRSKFSDNTDIKGNDAVLFVHGFIDTGKLGGYDHGTGGDDHKNPGGEYFDKFPYIIDDYTGEYEDKKFIPFVFQWRTNARFQDVANELGRAIRKIAEKTGKKVHIMAHSFGGVLIRTLVQNLSSSNLYHGDFSEKYIASITTVGTPHSGTFGSKTELEFDNQGTITFPEGRHGEVLDLAQKTAVGAGIDFCQAITCYQTGSSKEIEIHNDGMTTHVGGTPYYGTKSKAGYITYKTFQELDNYPVIPTQVLIGLVSHSSYIQENNGVFNITYSFLDGLAMQNPGVGDNLISIFGQRIIPDGDQSDLNEMYSENPNIEEHILPMDGRNNTFIRGIDDWIVENYGLNGINHFEVERYRVNLDVNDFTNFAYAYNHRTGQYDSGTVNFGKGISIYHQSEVGLQNCINSKDCNNSTWNYFKTFVDLHPADYITQDVNIEAVGKVLEDNGIPKQPYTIKVFVNDVEIASEVIDTSDYNISVLFKGKTIEESYNYHVEVIPAEGSGLRGAISNKIETDTTVVESNLAFNDILLVGTDYITSNMNISLKDATDNMELSDFNISVYDGDNLILSDYTNTASYIATVGVGDYTCKATKEGYKESLPMPCNAIKDEVTSYTINIYRDEAVGTARRIIVLADDITPWDTNAFTTIMNENGYTEGSLNGQYSVIPSSDIATTDFIVGKDLLIIMNDQNQNFYNLLSTNMNKIDTFVKNGGVLLFEVSDRGWNGGELSSAGITALPGGVTFDYNYDYTNINVNKTSTLMLGLDDSLSGTYASHESFSDLPVGTTVYTTDSNDKPTLIEYKYGLGWIIATGQPLEHGYDRALSIGEIYPKLYNYVLGNISTNLETRSLNRSLRRNNIIPSHK